MNALKCTSTRRRRARTTTTTTHHSTAHAMAGTVASRPAAPPGRSRTGSALPRPRGKQPQSVNGVVVTPGAVTARDSSFLSSIPTPLLAVLAALIAILGALGGLAARTLSAHAAPVSRGDGGSAAAALARFASSRGSAVAIAAAIVAMASARPAGTSSSASAARAWSPNITLQMSLTLGGGVALAAACAAVPRAAMRAYGLAAAVGLLALAAYTAISVVVVGRSGQLVARGEPHLRLRGDVRRRDRARAARRVALAQRAGRRPAGDRRAVGVRAGGEDRPRGAGGVGRRRVPDAYARLSLPFSYWNAVGLTAALGIPPCLWLGARREGHGVVNALAAPALCAAARDAAAVVLARRADRRRDRRRRCGS